MKRKGKALRHKKYPADLKANPRIATSVKQRAIDEEISCASSHQVAAQLNIHPSEVGLTIDLLGISMVKCQLGLYGYRPEKKIVKPSLQVTETLEQAIHAELVDGKLPCSAAWEIADNLNISKMAVSSACEALNIRIASCQLGAF
jgi:hypothetical protein